MMNKLSITFILIGAVMSVSTSAILVKLSTSPAPVLAFYRLFLAALLICPYFVWKSRKEIKNLTRREWLFSAIAGVLLAFHFILWFHSLEYTSVASSVVLVTLQPIFSFIGTYLLFKEKISYTGLLSACVAIIGSVIISWGDFSINGLALFGDLLALLACAFITGYLLVGQSVRERVSITTYTFTVYSFSSITLFLYCLVIQYPLIGYDMNEWTLFLLLAIFPTLLGHSLFNLLLKWVSTNIISIAILFEPVGAILLAYWLLREQVTLTQIIGGSVIILGISLFVLKR
ncbi:DMT family transporter [Bacillus carboniphilus]|uniref:DMT family transporter n=1 Tax=Bacillus carboniphilus TaxID=86663 RepID=A0ABY9JP78_9BACI|nr:DMT family transporter [Bacillus carboniphilus]WLR41209.1 DMT family transporter [Bacillus carboniphilus]